MTSVLSSYKQKDRGSGYFVQIVAGTHVTVAVPPPTVYIKTDATETLLDFSTPTNPTSAVTSPSAGNFGVGTLFKDIGREVYIYGPDTDSFITSPIRLQAIWREVWPVTSGEIPGAQTIWIKVFSLASAISVVRAG